MGPTRMRLSKPDSAVISGYAGWAPKQLESECARGYWHGLTADSDQLSFESVCIAGFKDIIFLAVCPFLYGGSGFQPQFESADIRFSRG